MQVSFVIKLQTRDQSAQKVDGLLHCGADDGLVAARAVVSAAAGNVDLSDGQRVPQRHEAAAAMASAAFLDLREVVVLALDLQQATISAECNRQSGRYLYVSTCRVSLHRPTSTGEPAYPLRNLHDLWQA